MEDNNFTCYVYMVYVRSSHTHTHTQIEFTYGTVPAYELHTMDTGVGCVRVYVKSPRTVYIYTFKQ